MAAVAVIGAGLAGSLAALALARQGHAVTLVGPAPHPDEAASVLSYAAILGRGPARRWRRLEMLHGPLGWRPAGLVLHGWPLALAAAPPALLAALTAPLPFSRVDAPTLAAALPGALAAAGVERWLHRAEALGPADRGRWRFGSNGSPPGCPESVDAVVLAAGAGCRALWPSLPERLRTSWAGVLALPRIPGGTPWLEQVRRGRIVQPRNWLRPALEAGAGTLAEPAWIVDAGLAPWGEGVLVGQISLVRPGNGVGEAPDPAWMEQRLREGLARLDPALASLEGPYRQVPVPFCLDGRPLVGPVEGAPGLWAFTGFSGAFAVVPELAEKLAAAVDRSLAAPGAMA